MLEEVHPAPLSALLFPTDDTLVTADQAGHARAWRVDGRLHPLGALAEGRHGGIGGLCAVGPTLYAAGPAGLFELSAAAPLLYEGALDGVVSARSVLFAWGPSGVVRVERGKAPVVFELPCEDVTCFDVDDAAKRFLLVRGGLDVAVHDAKTGAEKARWRVPDKEALWADLRFSPDPKWLYRFQTRDDYVRLVSTNSGRRASTGESRPSCGANVVGPTARSVDRGLVGVVRRGNELFVFDPAADRSVYAAPSTPVLTERQWADGFYRRYRFVEARPGVAKVASTRRNVAPEHPVPLVALSPSGRWGALYTDQGALVLHDTRHGGVVDVTRAPVAVFPPLAIRRWHDPDATRAVLGDDAFWMVRRTGEAIRHALEDGAEVGRVRLEGYPAREEVRYPRAMHADAGRFAEKHEGVLGVWDLATGALLLRREVGEAAVTLRDGVVWISRCVDARGRTLSPGWGSSWHMEITRIDLATGREEALEPVRFEESQRRDVPTLIPWWGDLVLLRETRKVLVYDLATRTVTGKVAGDRPVGPFLVNTRENWALHDAQAGLDPVARGEIPHGEGEIVGALFGATASACGGVVAAQDAVKRHVHFWRGDGRYLGAGVGAVSNAGDPVVARGGRRALSGDDGDWALWRVPGTD